MDSSRSISGADVHDNFRVGAPQAAIPWKFPNQMIYALWINFLWHAIPGRRKPFSCLRIRIEMATRCIWLPSLRQIQAREAFRHRCGAWTSNPVDGREVVGRFDSYTLPPHSSPPRSSPSRYRDSPPSRLRCRFPKPFIPKSESLATMPEDRRSDLGPEPLPYPLVHCAGPRPVGSPGR